MKSIEGGCSTFPSNRDNKFLLLKYSLLNFTILIYWWWYFSRISGFVFSRSIWSSYIEGTSQRNSKNLNGDIFLNFYFYYFYICWISLMHGCTFIFSNYIISIELIYYYSFLINLFSKLILSNGISLSIISITILLVSMLC